MHSFVKSIFISLLLIIGVSAIAQENDALQGEDYSIENVFGVSKATHGGLISGFYYRHSKALSEGNFMNYGIEIVNIKDAREGKETTITGSTFVFGKSNYLLAIRPTYGREKVLFKKAPQQGARITGLVAAGPSIGLEIPYFVELIGNEKEQYDPDDQRHGFNRIIGNAGPFRGLGSSKIVLGAHAKASLTFETNSTKQRVFGIEVGFTLDVYTREINILPVAGNDSIFTSAFLAIYFGRRR